MTGKYWKKLIAILLCMALCLTSIDISALASQASVEEGISLLEDEELVELMDEQAELEAMETEEVDSAQPEAETASAVEIETASAAETEATETIDDVELTLMDASSVSGKANETTIFAWLTSDEGLGLNAAAAVGILVNIYRESNFNSTSTNSSSGAYGICQWTDDRLKALKAYRPDDYDTVEGQLEYLKYELIGTTSYYLGIYNTLLGVSNDADGAYYAAYYWCYYYERPGNKESTSVSRGNTAVSTFWPIYSAYATSEATSALKITGATTPSTMTEGSAFSVLGVISSPTKLTGVTVYVYDTAGNKLIGASATPNATYYSLAALDSSIKFGSLAAGVYEYKVTATNSSGTTTLIDQVFVVLSTGKTISEGTYTLAITKNKSYGMTICDSSSSSGAYTCLATLSSSDNYMKFKFTYTSSGYYTIQNVGSGLYLSTASSTSSCCKTLQTSASSATQWQVLPALDGSGSYYLIPKCNTSVALNLQSGTVANGTYIQVYTANMKTAQRWTLTTTTAATASTKPTISGQTTPSTMTAGSSFSVKGTISSSTKITSVTAGVYNTAGTAVISKTVTPGTTSYSLANLDSSLKFGSLSAGVYEYKVTATNSSGTETLIDQVFVVLATAKTISDGTYYIAITKNKSYCISITGNSSTSGAYTCLAAKSTSDNYMKFQFTYDSSGYYKIKDVGSGLYLSVSGTSNCAKVTQSSTATLWQVLPALDGSGSYYLVPKSNTSLCMNLQSGVVASGTAIQIYTANQKAAQRWTLVSASTSTTAVTISGQTTPSTLTVGSSFSVKGTLSSSTKITSVTAAVYNTSGKAVISKSATPNATSYSLSKLDSSLKFGSLSAGVYEYKVTATNSSGTTTLIDQVFVVLSKSKTVSNGTYYIAIAKNTSYCVSIVSNSSSSGAYTCLAAKSTSNSYMKFKFTYQSDGYYLIQDVGSGKYLSVSGTTACSKVNQSSSALLWQVLSDGTGSYYLVPKSNTTMCMNLQSGVVAAGTNIQIYGANLKAAQRWKLVSA